MVSTGATLVGVVGSAVSESPPPNTAASGPTNGVTAMAAAATDASTMSSIRRLRDFESVMMRASYLARPLTGHGRRGRGCRR